MISSSIDLFDRICYAQRDSTIRLKEESTSGFDNTNDEV